MKPKVTDQSDQDPTIILHTVLQSCVCSFKILFNSILAFMPTRHLYSVLFILSNYIYACYMSNFISGFRCVVKKICVLLGFYIAYSDNSVSTFRNNLRVPLLRVKASKKNAGNTSVRSLNCSVCSLSAQE